jgi:hypothetical protein
MPVAADAADGAAGDGPAGEGSAAAGSLDAQPPVTPATIATAAIPAIAAACVAGEASQAGERLVRNVILLTPITAPVHYVNYDIVRVCDQVVKRSGM